MVLWCDFLSGWFAGMGGLVAGHPLDTIATVQQINCIPMTHSIKHILRHGNVLVFFRGMSFPLVTTGVLNSIFFGAYGYSLDVMGRWGYGKTCSKGYISKSDAPYLTHFTAGCIGGVAQLGLGCPVDVIKVQLQSRTLLVAKGPMHCVQQIMETSGISGLYKGMVSQAWRDIPSSGVYFVIYEFCKNQLIQGKSEVTKGVQFTAGGVAGVLSWWSTLPLDVIKSRLQGDCHRNPVYKGLMDCAYAIIKKDGVKGLFQGFWPVSLRAFIVNGVTFLVYEYLLDNCIKFHNFER